MIEFLLLLLHSFIILAHLRFINTILFLSEMFDFLTFSITYFEFFSVFLRNSENFCLSPPQKSRPHCTPGLDTICNFGLQRCYINYRLNWEEGGSIYKEKIFGGGGVIKAILLVAGILNLIVA